MSTDREDMAFAAKAAGYVIESDLSNGGHWVYQKDAEPNSEGERPLFKWRPRTDDGDSLRLAAKLSLTIYCPDSEPTAVACWEPWGGRNRAEEDAKTDPCAAIRLAIFRAAVAIGRAMP